MEPPIPETSRTGSRSGPSLSLSELRWFPKHGHGHRPPNIFQVRPGIQNYSGSGLSGPVQRTELKSDGCVCRCALSLSLSLWKVLKREKIYIYTKGICTLTIVFSFFKSKFFIVFGFFFFFTNHPSFTCKK